MAKLFLKNLLNDLASMNVITFIQRIMGNRPEWDDVDIEAKLIIERAVATDPEIAYYYALYVIRGRWPEGEAAIAKDPSCALNYAKYIIKGRWPEGEQAIATDLETSLSYSGLTGIRIPAFEDTIAKDPGWAYEYAKDVIKGRWPEGEPAIAKDGSISYHYAWIVLKCHRFPLGEPAIAKSPEWAYKYASNIMKHRFPAGEPAIAKKPQWSIDYAINVLHDRFPLGEPAIMSSQFAKRYAKTFGLALK